MRIPGTLLLATLAACGGEEMFSPELRSTDMLLSVEATARLDIDDETMDTAAVVGDLDGDGIEDAVLLTEYWIDLPGDQTDKSSNVYVLYGGTRLTGTVALAELPTLTVGAQYLPTVAAVGDVNGDGFADFTIGAPSVAGSSGVFLVYGSANRFVGSHPVDGAGVFLHDTAQTPLKERPIHLGDLDGDGLADFAIVHDSTAEVLVYYGRTQKLSGTIDMHSTADLVIAPSSGPYASAYGLGVGDTDGDGYADLVVSFNGNEETRLIRGSATRLSGTRPLAEIASTELVNTSLTWQFGTALGDLDGDGLADFALSSFDATRMQQTHLIYYGRAGGFGATVDAGEQDATVYGVAEIPGAIAIGDLDGDGRAELLVGDQEARDENGAVRVFPGTAQRLTGAIEADAPTLSYVGAPTHATHCEYVMGGGCVVREGVGAGIAVGDLTGDHRPDVLIVAGTSLFDAHKGVHGTSAGHAYLLQP